MARAAWRTGDPGLVFLDEINRHNPTPALGAIEATNPCGEVPLLPWEACTLGSINVARFWDPEAGDLDWPALRESAALAVRFLDDVVEANSFPIDEIHEAVRGNRKVGLGMMGFADLLIAAGIAYDSEAALALAGRLARELSAAADAASAALGAEKDVFPNWQRSVYADGPRYRNATRTCIAPTGTIAIIAGASSGIEPLFSLAHDRRMGDGTLLPEVNVAFEQAARDGGFYSPELIEELAVGARLGEHEQVPPEVRRRFTTAHDIAPQWHVRMQAAFQAHTDLAVSKTVNLPHDATTEQIRDVFLLAHELGCKGVTVYRDGSHAVQVLAHARAEAPTPAPPAPGPASEPYRRHLPDERRAVTHKFPRRGAGRLPHRRAVRGRLAGRDFRQDREGGLDRLRADRRGRAAKLDRATVRRRAGEAGRQARAHPLRALRRHRQPAGAARHQPARLHLPLAAPALRGGA